MGQLVRDRYFAADRRAAWDLATGETVPPDGAPEERSDVPPIPALVELLDSGREGLPRRVVFVSHRAAIPALLRRAAMDAQARGFVPVAVHVYFRFRNLLDEPLRDRAIVLLDGDPPHHGAWTALMDVAARSARPHVLLTLRGRTEAAPLFVREARASYGARPRRRREVPARHDSDTEQHLRRAARAKAFIAEGRHAAAERLLRDVAGAVLRRGYDAAAASVLIDLGTMLLERGRAADADRAFQEAATSAARAERDQMLAAARLWQAAARTDAGRLADAESVCRAVLSGDGLDRAQRVLALAHLARVLLWQDRIAEAAALDLDPAGDPDPAAHAFVEAIAVRVLIAAGRLFDAGLRGRQLLTVVAQADTRVKVIASIAHLRVLVASGDLAIARACLEQTTAAARDARVPVQSLRARFIYAEGLVRARRMADARPELRRLQRACRAATPLLRCAVNGLVRTMDQGRPVQTPPEISTSVSPVSLVTAAHDEERDADAVRRVLDMVAQATKTSRIDVCSADAGPVSVVMSVGGGLKTRLGARIIDAGLVLGPETIEDGLEAGAPARRGGQVFAAIVARWPQDRTPVPGVLALIELATAVLEPRLDAMLSGARAQSLAATSGPELVGVSAAMLELRTAIVRAAAAPFAVLVQGESGVGKELVARAIHQLGPRRERRFCDVNCAALPDDLLESELFGHARGAFTGAVVDKPGLFEDADGGTLFLDELGDLSLRAQAKLLRVVQQQEVRRIGETFGRKVDVRLVAAANRDMSAEAAAGRFRQDLLYRLDVIRIRIPPLRERPDDVAVLARHFWDGTAVRVGTTAALTHGVLAALTRYHWPGNVRELQNVVSALAVAAPCRGAVRASLLPAAITGATAVTSTRLADARAQFERRVIESALARAAGSRTRAARELGLSRQGLLKMMTRLGFG